MTEGSSKYFGHMFVCFQIIFLLDLLKKKVNTVPVFNEISIASGGLICTFDTSEGDDHSNVSISTLILLKYVLYKMSTDTSIIQ